MGDVVVRVPERKWEPPSAPEQTLAKQEGSQVDGQCKVS
jgi:hypothetical protein